MQVARVPACSLNPRNPVPSDFKGTYQTELAQAQAQDQTQTEQAQAPAIGRKKTRLRTLRGLLAQVGLRQRLALLEGLLQPPPVDFRHRCSAAERTGNADAIAISMLLKTMLRSDQEPRLKCRDVSTRSASVSHNAEQASTPCEGSGGTGWRAACSSRATHRMADGLLGVASNHELPQPGNGLQVSVRQRFSISPHQGHLLHDGSPTDHDVLPPTDHGFDTFSNK